MDVITRILTSLTFSTFGFDHQHFLMTSQAFIQLSTTSKQSPEESASTRQLPGAQAVGWQDNLPLAGPRRKTIQ